LALRGNGLLDVVNNLLGGLGDLGARPKDGRAARVVEELVVRGRDDATGELLVVQADQKATSSFSRLFELRYLI
jgi:hypothetical protein